MSKYCTQCGAKIDDDMLFCGKCGTKAPETVVSHKIEYEQKEKESYTQSAQVSTGTDKETGEKKKKKKFGLGKIITWVLVVLLVIGYSVIYYVLPVLRVHNSNQESAGTTNNTPSGDFDEILAQGGGYYIVKKHIETYETSHDEYGVIDSNSEWLTALSSDNYICQALAETMKDGYNIAYSPAEFVYLGEKMFAVKTHCALIGQDTFAPSYWATYAEHGELSVLNVENKTFFHTYGHVITKFSDGYMFVKGTSSVKRYDHLGNSKTLNTSNSKNEMYLGKPSMGLIYANQRFYDIKTGAIKIDLTKYDVSTETTRSRSIRSVNNDGNICFNQDGICTFKFFNPGHKLYVVDLDLEGNFVSEPQPVQ